MTHWYFVTLFFASSVWLCVFSPMSNSSTQQGMKSSMQSFLTWVMVLLSPLQVNVSLLRKPALQYLLALQERYCCTLMDQSPACECLKVRIVLWSTEVGKLLYLGWKSWIYRFSRGHKSPYFCVSFSSLCTPVKQKQKQKQTICK